MKDFFRELDDRYLETRYKKGEYQDLINKISAAYYNINNEKGIYSNYFEKQNVVLQLLLTICDNLSVTFPVGFSSFENDFTSKIVTLYKENLCNVIYKPINHAYISFKPYELERFRNEVISKQKAIRELLPNVAVQNSSKQSFALQEGDQYKYQILELYRNASFINPLPLFKNLQKKEAGVLIDEVFTQVEKLIFEKKIVIDKETGAVLVTEDVNKDNSITLDSYNVVICEELNFLDKKFIGEYDRNLDNKIDFALNYTLVLNSSIKSNYVNKIADEKRAQIDFYSSKSVLIDYLLRGLKTISNHKLQDIKADKSYEKLHVFVGVLLNDYFRIDKLGYLDYEQDKLNILVNWLEERSLAIYKFVERKNSPEIENVEILEEVVIESDSTLKKVLENAIESSNDIIETSLDNYSELKKEDDLDEDDLNQTSNKLSEKVVNEDDLNNPVLYNPYLCKYIDKERLLQERDQIESIFIKYKQSLTAEQIKELMYTEYTVDIKTSKIVDIIVWLLSTHIRFLNNHFVEDRSIYVSSNLDNNDLIIAKKDFLEIVQNAKKYSNHPKTEIFINNLLIDLKIL
ncbi:hypothetical protein HMPREF9714_01440 [Myroides odoratimimus CCUG 12901]|uniref:hypothetical protein n=1 Tax=Myroides odoratimimus TaxID=76832 RepID=UPI0002460952|nr:hypothetical protein [Myroides odoratimimus]EHO11011.1 hypothetical protein HMPREF9714_01440 [Myroides odoratimimus CCUG 12901]MDM1412419.1 hypothetical protein [Myroides odoratimimus]